MMKGNKRVFLVLAIVLVAVLIVLLCFMLPRNFSFQSLQKGDVFQYKNLKWGTGETAAMLSWFKPVKKDYYQGISPSNEFVKKNSEAT